MPEKLLGAFGTRVHNSRLMVLSIESFSRTPPASSKPDFPCTEAAMKGVGSFGGGGGGSGLLAGSSSEWGCGARDGWAVRDGAEGGAYHRHKWIGAHHQEVNVEVDDEGVQRMGVHAVQDGGGRGLVDNLEECEQHVEEGGQRDVVEGGGGGAGRFGWEPPPPRVPLWSSPKAGRKF